MHRFTRSKVSALGLTTLLLGLGACRDRQLLTDPVQPEGPTGSESSPSFVISDAQHSNGNAHFFFLPPLVSAPQVTGVFDSSLDPVVEICEWTDSCGALMARFTMTSGTGSEVIRMEATNQQYIVDWHTETCVAGPCTLDPAKTYRLRVLVAGVELGFADLDVVVNGSQLKNVQTSEYIGLVNGRTLPVKFRIEQGAVSVLPPGGTVSVGSSGGNITTADGNVVLLIPAGALTQATAISISQVPSPAPGAGGLAPVVDLGPNGTAFATPVTLVLRFAPESVPPGLPLSEIGVVGFDGTGWDVVPGGVVDAASHTVRVSLSHFSIYTLSILARRVDFSRVSDTVFVGQSGLYTALVRDSLGQPLQNLAVRWTSSDPSVASVPGTAGYTDAQGTVESPPITGNSPGFSSIRFQVGGVTSSARTFTVVPVPATAVTQVAAGGKSSCEQPVSGEVFCWGEESFGATDAASGLFTTIGGGGFHYCGLRPGQTIACWGYNSDLRATPPGGSFQQLAVGAEHNCALRTDDTAACWGFLNDGRGSPPAGGYRQITVGWYHGCAIRPDDSVVCWGRNEVGQANAPSGTFRSIEGLAYNTCGIRTDFTLACWGDPSFPTPPSGSFIRLGHSVGGHMCAIRASGTLACWGQNDFGQAIPPSGSFAQVSEGGWHSCGVRPDETVECWGSSATGAIDIPPAPPAPPPPGPSVAAGGKSSCELPLSGIAFCWGEASYGATDAPGTVFTTIGGGGFHYCGIHPDQTLSCWGYNSDLRATPPGGSFQQLAVGAEHNCALRTDDTAVCWGFLNDGRGSPPPGSYRQITVGWYHGCAIRPDDSVVCWGRNEVGQANAPSGTFRSIEGLAYNTCGIRINYTLACWGDPSFPTPPSGYFIRLGPSLGGHMCAVRFDGSLACWGQNDFGQASPPAGQFAQVSEGGWHSCGVKTDGTPVCWGSDATGAVTIP